MAGRFLALALFVFISAACAAGVTTQEAPVGSSSGAASGSPLPTPSAFALPQSCRVLSADQNGERIEWMVDCGADRNRSARQTIGDALTQQGWTACGLATAVGYWQRQGSMVGVSEPADEKVGFKISLQPKTSPCT